MTSLSDPCQRQKPLKATLALFRWIGIVCLALLLCRCSDPETVSIQQKKAENIFTHRIFYQNGRIARELGMLPDSTLHGQSLYYYPEGGLFKSVHYKEGVLEGISKTYYLNQQLESLVPYQNGLPQGGASWYTKEGQLKQEANYQNGKLEGWVNHYYPEGPLLARYYYEKDQKKGPGYDYYLNGQIKNWHFFNITGKEGFALSYDENGKITEAFGEILADLEVDRAALSWDNQFSVGIQVAVPPEFTGEVSVEKKGGGQSIQKGTLKPHQNTWRYRTRQLAKKEYVFYVSARITEPSGFSLSSKTSVIRLDLSGRTPQIMYE